MSDKQVFAAIIGGFISAVTGGLLAVPVTLLAHTDGGDDGWGIVWWGFMIVFGITALPSQPGGPGNTFPESMETPRLAASIFDR
jgi:hypothetical protein